MAELARTILVALSQELELAHEGYLKSLRGAKANVLVCASPEELLVEAAKGPSLLVVGAATKWPDCSGADLVRCLEELQPRPSAPILFLHAADTHNPVTPKTPLTLVGRWSDARLAMGLQEAAARKIPVPVTTGRRQGPLKLESTERTLEMGSRPKPATRPSETPGEGAAASDARPSPAMAAVTGATPPAAAADKGLGPALPDETEEISMDGLLPRRRFQPSDQAPRRDIHQADTGPVSTESQIGPAASAAQGEPGPKKTGNEAEAAPPPSEGRASPDQGVRVPAIMSDRVESKKTPAPAPRKETPAPAPRKETPAPAPRKETPAPAPRKETPAPAPRKEKAVPSAPSPAVGRDDSAPDSPAPDDAPSGDSTPDGLVSGDSRPDDSSFEESVLDRAETRRLTRSPDEQGSKVPWGWLALLAIVGGLVFGVSMVRGGRCEGIFDGPPESTSESSDMLHRLRLPTTVGVDAASPDANDGADAGVADDAATAGAAAGRDGAVTDSGSRDGSFGDGASRGSPTTDGATNDGQPAEVPGETVSPERSKHFGPFVRDILLPLRFHRNDRTPSRVEQEEILEIVRLVTKYRRLRFELIGHASPDEREAVAKRLGMQRAREARDLICSRGPSRSRFEVRSAGQDEPLRGEQPDRASRRVVLRAVGRGR